MSKIHQEIIKEIKKDKKRYWANDNISEYIKDPADKNALIEEAADAYQAFLKSLLIDTDNDPNSKGTAMRVAKMFINELFEGRYEPKPKVTAFPNDDPEQKYTGILNVRAEIKSMCSHHHQPVRGLAFIGLLPSNKVIGLSKYVRIAQWCARRGTLQEELARQICDEIMTHCQTEDVGVYVQGTHGCMENRGICAHNSLTQTSIVHGQFFNPSVKNEWLDQIKLQVYSGGSL